MRYSLACTYEQFHADVDINHVSERSRETTDTLSASTPTPMFMISENCVVLNCTQYLLIIIFYNCIVPLGFLHGKFGSLSLGKASCDSHATLLVVRTGYFSVSIIHRTLAWTAGSFTCVCDLFTCVYTRDLGLLSYPKDLFIHFIVQTLFITYIDLISHCGLGSADITDEFRIQAKPEIV